MYVLLILDANKNNILFATQVERVPKNFAEGILSQTDKLFLYHVGENRVETISQFENYYIINGRLIDDKCLAIGIYLGETDRNYKDRNYSVFYGDKNNFEEIYTGKNTWFFSTWPQLMRLGTEIVLK